MAFNVTTSLMNNWFTVYNLKYFNGELHRPIMKIKKAKSYYGKAFCGENIGENILVLSDYLERSEFEYKNTFIHEMIHFWQYKNFHTVDHKETFKKKANEINKDGWKIKRCSDTSGVKVNINNLKEKNVLIGNFKFNGMNCYCKINQNYLHTLGKQFKTHSLIRNFKLYSCKNNSLIDTLPSSRKKMTYYTKEISGKEVIETMKNAITLGTEIVNY